MPYIPSKDRDELDTLTSALAESIRYGEYAVDTNTEAWKGRLNYSISRLIALLVKGKGLRYHTLQDVMGTLDCVSREFYRRVVAPYEDGAIKKNGDVDVIADLALGLVQKE